MQLLNENIPGCGFAVKENATRIEERLRVKCALISSQATSGRKKEKKKKKRSYRMNVFVEEVKKKKHYRT